MRMHRILIAALAFALIGLVPFTSATANAAEVTAAKSSAAAAPAAAAKPNRTVAFKFKSLGRTTYRFTGKVQAAKNKKIIIQRSNSKKGKYRNFLTLRTNAKGNYATRNLKATGWFVVKVPSDKRFATSYSQLIRVFYT